MPYRPKILIVEADPATIRQLEGILRSVGVIPRSLPNGQQALQAISRDKFDGVFLDWDTPELDGVEVTRRIRESKSNARIPVAMLTSRADTRAIADGFAAGVTFFLSKPIGAKELLRLLNASRGAMLTDRRRYQRVPIVLPVACEWDDKRANGHSVNLSSRGLLATLSPRPEDTATVTVRFTLPRSHASLTLKGSVVRHGPGNQVGVKFQRLSADEQEALESFVEHAIG